MRRIHLRRPSASMVVALIALFVALGGSSYAALSISGKNIKNGTITSKDVKKGSLTGKQIKSGSLTGKQINASSLGQVPSAANAAHAGSADNASKLDGKSASDFAGQSRWIIIQGNGTGAVTLGQSGGFGTVTRLSTGLYSIDAGQSLAKRPMSVVLDAAAGNGFISLARCGGGTNNPGGIACPGVDDTSHVLVITNSTTGAAADREFELTIG